MSEHLPQSRGFLTDAFTRHAVYLQGLQASQQKKVEKLLRDLNRETRNQLINTASIDQLTRKRVRELISQVGQLNGAQADKFIDEITKEVLALAEYEAGFSQRALEKYVNAQFSVPTPEALAAAIRTNPLNIETPASKNLLEPFLRDLKPRTVNRISNAIRQGYYQGETTFRVLQRIRGTKALGYRDGILARVNNDAMAVVRTALQHTAMQARQAVGEENDDIIKGVRWLSVLDNRTSITCRSLDGKQFPLDSGPRPPIHYRCRSDFEYVFVDEFDFLNTETAPDELTGTRVARTAKDRRKLDTVPGDETYYEWIKRQPAKFQRSALGPTRYKLFRDSGMTAEKFAELNIGNKFTPRTLREMAELEPLAFEKAGIKIESLPGSAAQG